MVCEEVVRLGRLYNYIYYAVTDVPQVCASVNEMVDGAFNDQTGNFSLEEMLGK